MSARSQVAALLRPHLPDQWRFITTEVGVDKIDTTLVRLRQTAIQRHPAAPNGSRHVEFECRVTVPGINYDTAEDRLDEDTDTLLWAIEAAGGALHWSRAEKVHDGNNMAYSITLTATTSKPTE